jgi:hypothetical protein
LFSGKEIADHVNILFDEVNGPKRPEAAALFFFLSIISVNSGARGDIIFYVPCAIMVIDVFHLLLLLLIHFYDRSGFFLV